jgi:hypothetical protein
VTLPPEPPREALSALHGDEPALAFAWARVAKFGTPFGTFYPIGLFVRAVDLVRNRTHIARLRKVTARLGFPLDRHMAMLVTPTRLLVWKATHHPRRLGQLLGEVPQDRIVAAILPFSNTGPWKTVRLSLTGITPVHFQVDAASSARFISALEGGSPPSL